MASLEANWILSERLKGAVVTVRDGDAFLGGQYVGRVASLDRDAPLMFDPVPRAPDFSSGLVKPDEFSNVRQAAGMVLTYEAIEMACRMMLAPSKVMTSIAPSPLAQEDKDAIERAAKRIDRISKAIDNVLMLVLGSPDAIRWIGESTFYAIKRVAGFAHPESRDRVGSVGNGSAGYDLLHALNSIDPGSCWRWLSRDEGMKFELMRAELKAALAAK